MSFTRLLAKSPRQRHEYQPEETLPGHTLAVCDAAATFSSLTKNQVVSALGLKKEVAEYWPDLLCLCAWLHDWGKANDHFQKMLRKTITRQGLRHEFVSIALLEDFDEWLEPVWQKVPSWGKAAVVFTVAGHHLKCPDPQKERPGTKITLFRSHKDFMQTLEIGMERFSLDPVPILEDKTYSLLRRGLGTRVRMYITNLAKEDFSQEEKKWIAALKTTFLSADLAGSALLQNNNKVFGDLKSWFTNRLQTTVTSESLTNVVNQKIGRKALRPFQYEVKKATAQTVILEAGCGSGKTVAAYLWAAEHGNDRRLFFCYPTTGTASEGFSGYLNDPDFDALLLHSRAHVDYQLLPNMPIRNKEDLELHRLRLEAIETWPKTVVVCTAHTVLGLLENARRGLYTWPSILRGVFVFDEIHAYSDRVFSYLLEFLDIFRGVPVLLMTATLPENRRKSLETICRNRGKVQFFHGPQKREEAKRYILFDLADDLKNCKKQVKKSLNEGGKVLWVSNTVGTVMKLLDWAEAEGLPVEPYHSRFKYKDRLVRHRTVLEKFSRLREPVLALTTQVAEISLDLSADLLVSDYAPIPSLIQRLGRENRALDQPSELKPALFLKPAHYKPYEEQEIRNACEWVKLLADGKPKSQRDLNEAFVKFAFLGGEKPRKRECNWLEGLWRTETNKTSIEESGYSIEVLLEEDAEKANPVEFALPMIIPARRKWVNWKRKGRYLIVPEGEITYSERRGGQWKKA